MDKVSIIVPAYNVEEYLARTLSSLVNQTYRNVEIIVVDDCSKDGTRRVIQDFAKKDERVVPMLLDRNGGVSNARNIALEAVTGDWVCFCDGDDWFEPDFVEEMLYCSQKENADYIICNYKIAAEGRAAFASGSIDALRSGCERKRVIALGPTASCTHMIRRELFERAGVRYPVGCKQSEELPVIPVLAKYAERIALVDQPLYNYFQRGNGTSASNMAVESEKNFRMAWHIMRERLGEEYLQEAEFHAIYALLYGEILKLCKQKTSAKEIRRKILEFEREFPAYHANPYLAQMGRAKRVFLVIAQMRWVAGLRVLAWVHGKIVN